nr:unnamed protein product [Callosobruchus analis]
MLNLVHHVQWSAKEIVPTRGRTLKHNIVLHFPGIKRMSRGLDNTVDPLADWSLLFSDDIVEQVVQWTDVKNGCHRDNYKHQSGSTIGIDMKFDNIVPHGCKKR